MWPTHYYPRQRRTSTTAINELLISPFHFYSQNIKSKFSHVRKQYDAVLHCMAFANKTLPTTFKQQGKVFLDGYKKKHAQHKLIGKVKEIEVDPIPFPLYTMLCQWTMEENSFVWARTVSQCICMARSTSVDPLGKWLNTTYRK